MNKASLVICTLGTSLCLLGCATPVRVVPAPCPEPVPLSQELANPPEGVSYQEILNKLLSGLPLTAREIEITSLPK